MPICELNAYDLFYTHRVNNGTTCLNSKTWSFLFHKVRRRFYHPFPMLPTFRWVVEACMQQRIMYRNQWKMNIQTVNWSSQENDFHFVSIIPFLRLCSLRLPISINLRSHLLYQNFVKVQTNSGVKVTISKECSCAYGACHSF